MAPSPRPPEGSINKTPVYEEFIAKLAVYHQKRGTNFDPIPKVGTRIVDLKRLFDAVVEAGGYDKVSGIKLAWRKVGDAINFGEKTDAAKAFGLKTVYYKNLAAYEISTIHGKEPPPKEILEDQTAAGGELLTRTIESYRPVNRRETGHLGNGDSDNSGDEGTPVRDRGGSEETPGSGSGRVTRGLRQAPPQRVLFQPDSTTSRQSRQPQPQPTAAPSSANIPRGASSSYTPSSNPENMSYTVNNYEPRQPVPLTLRPVTTPGNNPAEFAKRQRMLREHAAAANGRNMAAPSTKIMLPGTGFDGPNIYVRCLFALRSGTPAEQDYALHHLVKISMERGDKYRFESFPGLAEALIEKVLEVSSLFYEVKWRISYTEDDLDNTNTLNGLQHTMDIIDRIANLVPKSFDDNIQPAETSDQLLMINEAALTLRNMVMLEENAAYVSELYPLRDFLSIALNLPNYESVVELKHYALEIAEQLTKNMSFEPEDPLYVSLLAQIQQSDRGAILTSLRAISRISMNLAQTNQLKGIPIPIVQRIVDWLLLEDEELLHACLDFLYQYTAVVENVDAMCHGVLLDKLVNQLVRLLSHGNKVLERTVDLRPGYRTPSPQEIPSIPSELMEQLLQLEETERSSQWLRCLFEEDADESITQILLWQSYQSAFSQALSERGLQMLAAAEFIKNVSATFAEKASAQVQSGPVQKFIIKGIRIRDAPVDFTGKPYSICRWVTKSMGTNGIDRQCGEYILGPERMFEHLLTYHLEGAKIDEGKYDNTWRGQYDCRWAGCGKYPQGNGLDLKLSDLARHVQQHLQRTATGASATSNKKSRPSWYKPGVRFPYPYHETAKDERHEAAGVPLTAALVLRNLVRTLPKTEANEKAIDMDGGRGPSLVDKLFKPVEPKLWEIASLNRILSSHINQLMSIMRENDV